MFFRKHKRWLLGAGLAVAIGAVLIADALQVKGLTHDPGYSLGDKFTVRYLGLPNFVFEMQLKGPPEVIDGQTLHPKMQYLFEKHRSPEASARYEAMLHSEDGRRLYRQLTDSHWPLRTKVTKEMAKVEDRTIRTPGGELGIRIYTPQTRKPGPLPVLTYFHGGAYIFASIDAVDRYARLIANEAEVIVVSGNYRLAPEHIYPAALEDGAAVFQWVAENAEGFGGDASRIAVGGDSAGASISLYASLRAIETGARVPDYQLLYYPSIDLIGTGKYPSEELFKFGYGLDPWIVDTAIEFLFPDGFGPAEDVKALLQRRLAELPASYVGTAGFDILRDHGRALVAALGTHGVPVTYEHYPSLAHNYLEHSGTIDDAERAAVSSARILGTFLWSLPDGVQPR